MAVQATFTVAGTVDAFDGGAQLAFRTRLAALLPETSPEQVTLRVAPGSIFITALIQHLSDASAASAVDTLTTTPLGTLAASLAVPLTAIGAPVVLSLVHAAPSPPPPSPPPPAPPPPVPPPPVPPPAAVEYSWWMNEGCALTYGSVALSCVYVLCFEVLWARACSRLARTILNRKLRRRLRLVQLTFIVGPMAIVLLRGALLVVPSDWPSTRKLMRDTELVFCLLAALTALYALVLRPLREERPLDGEQSALGARSSCALLKLSDGTSRDDATPLATPQMPPRGPPSSGGTRCSEGGRKCAPPEGAAPTATAAADDGALPGGGACRSSRSNGSSSQASSKLSSRRSSGLLYLSVGPRDSAAASSQQPVPTLAVAVDLSTPQSEPQSEAQGASTVGTERRPSGEVAPPAEPSTAAATTAPTDEGGGAPGAPLPPLNLPQRLSALPRGPSRPSRVNSGTLRRLRLSRVYKDGNSSVSSTAAPASAPEPIATCAAMATCTATRASGDSQGIELAGGPEPDADMRPSYTPRVSSQDL